MSELVGNRIELTVDTSESSPPLRLLLLSVGKDAVDGRVGVTVEIETAVVGKRIELTVEISEPTSPDRLLVKLLPAVDIDNVEGKEMLPVGATNEIEVVGNSIELTVDTSEATFPDRLAVGAEAELTVRAERDRDTFNCTLALIWGAVTVVDGTRSDTTVETSELTAPLEMIVGADTERPRETLPLTMGLGVEEIRIESTVEIKDATGPLAMLPIAVVRLADEVEAGLLEVKMESTVAANVFTTPPRSRAAGDVEGLLEGLAELVVGVEGPSESEMLAAGDEVEWLAGLVADVDEAVEVATDAAGDEVEWPAELAALGQDPIQIEAVTAADDEEAASATEALTVSGLRFCSDSSTSVLRDAM